MQHSPSLEVLLCALVLNLKPSAPEPFAAGLLTVGTALSVSLLAALGPALAPHTVEAHPMEIAVAAPDLSSEIGAVSRLGTYTPKHYEISSSDTIFSLFAKLGIHDDQARDYIFTQQRLTPFLAPQPGQHVTAGVSMLDNSNTCGSISTAHARIIPAQLKFRASAENSSAMCFPLLFDHGDARFGRRRWES